MNKLTAGDRYAEWVETIPDLVSDKIRLELHRKYRSGYIFYRRHKWGADCYCTNCLNRFQARYDLDPVIPKNADFIYLAEILYHNTTVTCPMCGVKVTAKAEGKGRKRLFHWSPVAVWSFADDGQTVYIVCGEIFGGFGRRDIGSKREYPIPIDEMEKCYSGSEWSTHWIVRLRPGEVKAARRAYGVMNTDYFTEKDLKEPWDYCGSIYNICHYFTHYNISVLKDTFLKYSYEVYNRYLFDYTIKFMEYSALYPSVEMLCKSGFHEIIEDIVDYRAHCKREINLSGTKPAEIFRTDSNKAAALMRYGRENDLVNYPGIDILAVIKMWKLLLKFNPKAKIEEAQDVCVKFKLSMVVGYGYSDHDMVKCRNFALFEKCCRKVGLSPVKIGNYLEKQDITIILYMDYVNECEQLGFDLSDSIINRPKDFAAAHERTASAVRTRIEEEKARANEGRRNEYRRKIYPALCDTFEYSDSRYSIIVPTCCKDIFDEARQQRNCVAGYAERHISGSTIILFLRKTDDMNTSFGTLEIGKNGGSKTYYFRQAYAAENKQLPKAAKKWLDRWLEGVNETNVKVQVTA